MICQLTENLLPGDAISDHVRALDGAMRELFCGAEDVFTPEDGEIITSVTEMYFTEDNGLVTAVAVASDGSEAALSLFVRGEGGAA